MNRRRPTLSASRTSGFTLLEILMVVALFAMIAAVVFSGSEALLRSAQRDDTEQRVFNAFSAARRESVTKAQTIELRADEKAQHFDWGAGSADFVGDERVRLLPMEGSQVLIGGRAVTEALPLVKFYPDGTCDPCRIEFVSDRASRILTIDPWTCAALAPVSDTPKRR